MNAPYGGQQFDMKPFRQMYLTVSALPTILILLTFVLWFMLEGPGVEEEAVFTTLPTLQYVLFGVVALASLPLAVVLRRLALRQTGDFTAQKRFSAPQAMSGQAAALGRITSAAVVGMATPEISVILGFVACFLTGEWMVYLPFALYSVIGWAVMYPRPSQVRAWYARQMGIEPVPSIIT